MKINWTDFDISSTILINLKVLRSSKGASTSSSKQKGAGFKSNIANTNEVEKVVKFLKLQGNPHYLDGITEDREEKLKNNPDDETDELYIEAVKLVMSEKRASTSFIQRKLRIGYNRAAEIIEKMEKNNIVSEADKVGRREVLTLKTS